jgi:peroxiredoxin
MPKKLITPLIYIALMIALGLAIRYFVETKNPSNTNMNNNAVNILFNATFPNAQGQQISLKPYQGKTIVLNFWATWCGPCREEMPELSTLYTANKDRNVVVLGIAIDDVNAVKEFSQEVKVAYPLFAADNQGMDLANAFGNDKGVLPYTIIIHQDGSFGESFFGRITQDLIEKSLAKTLYK